VSLTRLLVVDFIRRLFGATSATTAGAPATTSSTRRLFEGGDGANPSASASDMFTATAGAAGAPGILMRFFFRLGPTTMFRNMVSALYTPNPVTQVKKNNIGSATLPVSNSKKKNQLLSDKFH